MDGIRLSTVEKTVKRRNKYPWKIALT